MKRILLDQGLASLTAVILRDQGWDAVHVSEVNLDKANDILILDAARENGQVCVTLDHDFHAHLAFARADHPSVVLLRIEGLDATAQAALICAVWATCEEELAKGAAVSANNNTVRVRRLPLR